jgi:hypothetical protein
MDDIAVLRFSRSRCGWPRLYYGVVQRLAQKVGARRIAEIGVAYGYHADELLRSLPNTSYYGIDPYLAGYDAKDPFVSDVAEIFSEMDPQRAMDRLYAAVDNNINQFAGRGHLLRALSIEGAKNFPDGFFDLIFIDGDHTYDAVVVDLAAWWPRLRGGGIFCGDDYVWPEVSRAVDEFVERIGTTLRFASKPDTNYPIWFVAKPGFPEH